MCLGCLKYNISRKSWVTYWVSHFWVTLNVFNLKVAFCYLLETIYNKNIPRS